MSTPNGTGGSLGIASPSDTSGAAAPTGWEFQDESGRPGTLVEDSGEAQPLADGGARVVGGAGQGGREQQAGLPRAEVGGEDGAGPGEVGASAAGVQRRHRTCWNAA